MNLSFDDKESFVEAAGSLRFNLNNPPSDPSPNTTYQQVGTQEKSEDIGINSKSSNDPNILQRTGRISEEVM
jgi:hypothetical protein